MCVTAVIELGSVAGLYNTTCSFRFCHFPFESVLPVFTAKNKYNGLLLQQSFYCFALTRPLSQKGTSLQVECLLCLYLAVWKCDVKLFIHRLKWLGMNIGAGECREEASSERNRTTEVVLGFFLFNAISELSILTQHEQHLKSCRAIKPQHPPPFSVYSALTNVLLCPWTQRTLLSNAHSHWNFFFLILLSS